MSKPSPPRPTRWTALTWHEIVEAGHGRIERRRRDTPQDVAWLLSDLRYAGEPAMPALTVLSVVDSTVERDGRMNGSRRDHLSSACLAPGRFAAAARSHWSTENSQHRQPALGVDRTFDEDRARDREDDGPENPAVLCRQALDVSRTAWAANPIRRENRRAGWSDDSARSILARMR